MSSLAIRIVCSSVLVAVQFQRRSSDNCFNAATQTIDVCDVIVKRRRHTNAVAPLHTGTADGEQAVAGQEIVNDSLIIFAARAFLESKRCDGGHHLRIVGR
jgi:hypothetical protein